MFRRFTTTKEKKKDKEGKDKAVAQNDKDNKPASALEKKPVHKMQSILSITPP